MPPSLNARMSWRTKAKVMRFWRTLSRVKTLEREVPPLDRIQVSAVFRRGRLRVADEDNDRSRLKPCIDGIVDAGVIKKDTRTYLVWGPVTEERGQRGFTITIEELDR